MCAVTNYSINKYEVGFEHNQVTHTHGGHSPDPLVTIGRASFLAQTGPPLAPARV